MRGSEVQSLAEIAGRSVAKPSAVARDVQAAVSARVFSALGPLGLPARVIHEGVSRVSYRAVGAGLGAPLALAGRAAARRASPEAVALSDSRAGALALGALNGVFGDRLARDHPEFALELGIRHDGREVSLDAASLASAFPEATPRLAVFVHGLCETEEAWQLGSGGGANPSYGERLLADLAYTPLYLRYNTGLHVSDNGRRLAAAAEEIVANWPLEVEEIALVGHSMGGLVARSAAHYGEGDSQAWIERLRHVFCLGTPHLGAALEKAANVAGWPFTLLPEARPFGELFINGRSAGIKDLRFGNCVEDDWCDCDPDEFLRDRCCEVPFLATATYYFVGATLSRRPDGLASLVGDLLVRYPSASGSGRRRRIGFEIENGRHIGGLTHFHLLNHPDVYAQIRNWLERGTLRVAPDRLEDGRS
jgi:pimeloyl-ACP methyl ester carboxylesterase